MALYSSWICREAEAIVTRPKPSESWIASVLCGDVAIRLMNREEVARLAADLLDAIGATSFESVDMDNALPAPIEAAIKRNEVRP